MNTARQSLTGAGTQTSALAFGGGVVASPISTAATAATESWNQDVHYSNKITIT
jgi:hypothetical protein